MVFNSQNRLGRVNRHLGVEDSCLADECPLDGIGLVVGCQAVYDESVLVCHLNGVVIR